MFEGLFAPTHLILVLFIALIFFGPGKLPELGEALGKSIREFRKGVRAMSEDALAEDALAEDGLAAENVATALPPSSGVSCATCGTVSTAQNHFCGKCGQALAEPVAAGAS